MSRREIILSLIRPYLHWSCIPLGERRFFIRVSFVYDGRRVDGEYQVKFVADGISRNAFASVVEGAENAILSELMK